MLTESSPSSAPPRIRAQLMPQVNLLQGLEPSGILSAVHVHGAPENDAYQLTLSLHSTPEVLRPRTWHIDALPAGSVLAIADARVALNPQHLTQEPSATRARVTLILQNAAHIQLAAWSSEFEVSASRQWPGCNPNPALLAAFIEPQDEAVRALADRATNALAKRQPAIKNPGAHSGPEAVWYTAAAVWRLAVDLKLAEVLSAPSCVVLGQMLRPAQDVLNQRRATAMEAAVLLAGIFEALDLHVLPLLIEGRTLLGLWLTPAHFELPVVLDLAQVSNRVFAMRELLVLDPTCVFAPGAVGLRASVEMAEGVLRQLQRHELLAAVDVTACRVHGMLPLTASLRPAAAEPCNEPSTHAPPSWLSDLGGAHPHQRAQTPQTHRDINLAQWQSDLLDLGLRNPLLNLKSGTKALPLVAPHLAKLEQALAQGRCFQLHPALDDQHFGCPTQEFLRADGSHELQHRKALLGFSQDILYLDAQPKEAAAQLGKLYKKRRELQEEGDPNTLYLAIGSLRWKKETQPASHLAPLLLVPVVLARGSSSDAYTLEAADDEPVRFNPTLLKYLQQEFRICLNLDGKNLPRSAPGIDVDFLLRTVGQAVAGREGWEVVADCHVALLSFSRYLLWRDLEQQAAILERNPVVDHLMSRPLETFAPQEPASAASELDASMPPEQMLCPLPADSSQLMAVQAALQGQSFVLIGPPGTGKSQTIANIIAQCVAHGKQVLFVSAKSAALNVVYERLEALGLSRLCLSMHQHDGGRGRNHVVHQLQQAWQQASLNVEKISTEATQLQAWQDARQHLRAYDEALHAPGTGSLTPFTAMGLLAAHPSVPAIDLHWGNLQAHDCQTLQGLQSCAQSLALAATDALDLFASPLAGLSHASYGVALEKNFRAHAQRAAGAAQKLQTLCDEVAQWLPLPKQDLRGLPHTVQLLAHVVGQSRRLRALGTGDWVAAADALETAAQCWARVAAASERRVAAWPEQDCRILRNALAEAEAVRHHRAALQKLYPSCCAPSSLGLALGGLPNPGAAPSATALHDSWQRAHLEPWPRRWWLRRRVAVHIAQLRAYAAPLPQRLHELKQLANLERATQRVAQFVPPEAAGNLWRGEHTDGVALRAALALQDCLAGLNVDEATLAPVAKGLCGRGPAEALQRHGQWRAAGAQLAAVAGSLVAAGVPAHLLPPGKDTLSDMQEAAAAYRTLDQLLRAVGGTQWRPLAAAVRALIVGDGGIPQEFAAAVAQLAQKGPQLIEDAHQAVSVIYDPQSARAKTHEPWGCLSDLAAHANALDKALPRLRHWCAWQQERARAHKQGLGPLADALARGALSPSQTLPAFLAAYARGWLEGTLEQRPPLEHFRARQHDATVATFRDADEALCQQFAQRLLAHRSTVFQSVQPHAADAGCLSHQLHKNKNHLSTRHLLDAAGAAIRKLTPCFMMSPLSVARYLNVESAPFDVVIFDEASQLRVSEAVGAMGRAKQVIVVGDPKQLPPTQFFNSKNSSTREDLPFEPVRLESVLDHCRTAGLKEHILRWHYRSQHEGLIAFSNQAYYGGNLITFCPPVRHRGPISYHQVPEAYWDTGRARNNPKEARALVADVVQKVREGAFGRNKHTVGIIAFNGAQADLIDELLQAEACRDARLASAIAQGGTLSLFVKSLENVQGDERDVIYLSVAYGAPGPNRPLAARFGPLNEEGGERRLNVAISRARVHMHVFCSFSSDALPMHSLRSRGAQDLKAFLAYAQHGTQHDTGCVSRTPRTTPFERSVMGDLQRLGWEVVAQVGQGNFRIDLAVVDPHQPERFLAAIECDGLGHSSAATVRDRHRTRQAVLQNLGWRILRLWSTAYWQDAPGTVNTLHQQLLHFSHDSAAASPSDRPTAPPTNSPSLAV